MAERGIEEPLFYRGFFHHRSVRSSEMTKAERIQYRGFYRQLLKVHGSDYRGMMKARAQLRTMLYSDFGERGPR